MYARGTLYGLRRPDPLFVERGPFYDGVVVSVMDGEVY